MIGPAHTLVDTMRTFILAATLCLLHASGSAQVTVIDMPPERPPRPLVDISIGEYERQEDGSLQVEFRIMNSSPDTVHYLMMSCSTEDLLMLDTLSCFELVPSVCDKNVPQRSTLPPGKLSVYRFTMKPLQVGRRGGRYVRGMVGWRYVPVPPGTDLSTAFEQREQLGSIVWSEPLPNWSWQPSRP